MNGANTDRLKELFDQDTCPCGSAASCYNEVDFAEICRFVDCFWGLKKQDQDTFVTLSFISPVFGHKSHVRCP